MAAVWKDTQRHACEHSVAWNNRVRTEARSNNTGHALILFDISDISMRSPNNYNRNHRNQIKKVYCWACQWNFLIDEYLAKLSVLICLLTTPPRLKYVATLSCNVSVIACFLTLMFHKVVWQHMQGVVRFLITTLMLIYLGVFWWKKIWKPVEIWQNYSHETVVSLFGPPCILHEKASGIYIDELE